MDVGNDAGRNMGDVVNDRGIITLTPSARFGTIQPRLKIGLIELIVRAKTSIRLVNRFKCFVTSREQKAVHTGGFSALPAGLRRLGDKVVRRSDVDVRFLRNEFPQRGRIKSIREIPDFLLYIPASTKSLGLIFFGKRNLQVNSRHLSCPDSAHDPCQLRCYVIARIALEAVEQCAQFLNGWPPDVWELLHRDCTYREPLLRFAATGRAHQYFQRWFFVQLPTNLPFPVAPLL